MAADAKQALKTWENLFAEQGNFRGLWQQIAELQFPRKSGILADATNGGGGQAQTRRLFNATAIRANELLAASMQGSLTPSLIAWFRLKPRNEKLLKNRGVMAWCEETTRRVFRALQQSNFNAEVQEVYLDLGPFGIGSLFVEEREPVRAGFAGLQFTAQSLGRYVIAEAADGRVDTLYRKIQMSAIAAKAKWAANVGPHIAKRAEGSNPYEQVEILHGVYPRLNYNRKSRRATEKKWASCYVSVSDKHLLGESGFDEFPFMVPRWAKASGETYGRGPGMTAQPDVETLNRAIEMNLRAWAKAIDPPQSILVGGMVDENVDQRAGAENLVYNQDAIRPMESKSRFDVTAINVDALKQDIRHVYYWEQLQLPQQQMFTATEVNARLDVMQRILGPTLGRLEFELLQPLIERIVALMLRGKALDAPPQELLTEVGGLDIEYEGPLARAQKASEVQSLGSTLQMAGPIIQIEPDAADVYDFDAWLRFIAQRNGLPVELVRAEDQVEPIRQAKTQAREQQAQMAQAETLGKAAPGIGKMMQMAGPQGAQE